MIARAVTALMRTGTGASVGIWLDSTSLSRA